MDDVKYAKALEQFRKVYAQRDDRKGLKAVLGNKAAVLARYGPVFQPDTIPQLPEETFRSFLYFENNSHWSGLYRKGLRLCKNMDALRTTIAALLDPSRPIAQRYHRTVGSINGFGKGIATAILIVSAPDKYGVWNNTSEGALKVLDIWPEFPRGAHNGQRYDLLNQFLHKLAGDLGVDLWTLDALMWGISPSEEEELEVVQPVMVAGSDSDREVGFPIERHLHNFIFDNWERLSLGKEWELYGEDGDDEPGYEYPTGVGRIDLLAHHRSKPEWLIIELKKDRTSDATVGQLLRYIGWVKIQLAEKGDTVRGMIIARGADDGLRYAVSALPGTDIALVSFWCKSGTAAH